jgi:cysteine desulfurase
VNGAAPERLFCDANAGVPPLAEVLATFADVERRCPGNPASPHAAGRTARGVLEQARRTVAAAFGLDADDVVFTGGGTEACNFAVAGLGDPELPVLLSPAEHPAVYEPAGRRGARWWRVDETGRAVVTAPDAPVGLLALVHAQSAVGTLQPVDDAARLADELRVPLFVDAAQSLGRVPLQALADAGTIVALSPHKAGGLRGHGVLLGRALAQRVRPLLLGGSQELGLRAGTQSPALAAANALAIERAVHEQTRRAAAMTTARDAFLAGVRAGGGGVRVLTPLPSSAPNTVMLCCEETDGRHLLPALDLAGVEASQGSACSTGAPTPPRVLAAMGLDDARARSCMRVSFDWRVDVDACERAGRITARVQAPANRGLTPGV